MSENNTTKYEEKNSKIIKDIDDLLGKGSFDEAKKQLDEMESSEQFASDPRYHIRRILAEKKDTTLSHLLYEDRKYPSLLKDTMASPDWAKVCTSLSEEDRIFQERVNAFCDICYKIGDHILNAPPHMNLSLPDPANRGNDHRKLPVNNAKPAEAPAKTGPVQSYAKTVFTIFAIFFAIIFVISAIMRKPELIAMFFYFLFMFVFPVYGISLLVSSNNAKSTEKKSGPPVLNTNKTPAEIEAESSFRKEMVRLQGLQWDAYKDLQEAEKELNRNLLIAEHKGPEEGKAGISGKTCSNCGSNMAFDKDRKILVCPFCGNKKTLDEVDESVSIGTVNRLILERRYSKAASIIVDLKKKTPDDPALIVRDLRCSFRSAAIADGLFARRKNATELRRISALEDLNKLQELLPNSHKSIVGRVREYCSVSLSLLENTAAPGRDDLENRQNELLEKIRKLEEDL